MSKSRAVSRAQRAEQAAQRTAQAQVEAQRRAAERAKQDRRTMWWRRVRLWQHGAGFRRNRERWGALATLVLMSLLVVYIVTRDWDVTLGAALILVIALPVLVLLFFDKDRK